MQSKQELDNMMSFFKEKGDEPTGKNTLESLFSPLHSKWTPKSNLSEKDQDRIDNTSIEDVNKIPKSFRKRLEKNKDPIPEQRLKEMFVLHENLRKKGMPKSVIRNAIKREFGIAEYN